MNIFYVRRSLAILLSFVATTRLGNAAVLDMLLPAPPPAVAMPASASLAVGNAASLGDSPYLYHAARVTLNQVLQDFARHFGLRLSGGEALTSIVNGRVSGDNPGQFIDRLAGMYGFDWFIADGSLHVSQIANRRSATISVPGVMVGRIRGVLRGMGLFDPRYGWAEVPEQNAIIVSGPPAYLRAVEDAVRRLGDAPNSQQIALIRLRHANVQDRSISNRGESLVVPGIATTLRKLLGQRAFTPPSSEGGAKRAEGSASDSGGGDVSPSWGGVAGPVSIDSDPRLNAIILKAPPELLPSYRKLIEDLDVPSPLVQIEATIIDVDVTQDSTLGITWQGGSAEMAGRNNTVADSMATLSITRTILSRALNIQLMAKVNALAAKNQARVVSKPSILTTDNLSAVLDMSQSFFIKNSNDKVAETTQYTTGLSLKVTPRVIYTTGEEAKVALQIDIEDGIVDGNINSLPTIKKSTISTQAVVGNTQSLMIAGHQRDSSTRGNTKVPGLGDLPVFGGLFRNSDKRTENVKRYFLITPTIIDANQAAGSADAFIQKEGYVAPLTRIPEESRPLAPAVVPERIASPPVYPTPVAALPPVFSPAPVLVTPSPIARATLPTAPQLPTAAAPVVLPSPMDLTRHLQRLPQRLWAYPQALRYHHPRWDLTPHP